MGEHILVIGATLLDTKGKPLAGLQPGTSNPASIRHARGGAARNVAENLGRLGANVILISAVGDDETGRRLLEQTRAAGVNTDHVIMAPGHRSGAYIALLDPDGTLAVALDDVTVMKHVTSSYVYHHRRLFRDAQLVMFDGSLAPETMQSIVNLAGRYRIPLVADPSSARLAFKLRPHLTHLSLVVPNEVEAAALCGASFLEYAPEESIKVALELRHAGVATVVVTLSDYGLVFATSDETGYIPARYSEIVDSTGTGDALTAAIMFGMVNDLPLIECIRLGAAAASLTLQTGETVVADLSLDMLYDHLVV